MKVTRNKVTGEISAKYKYDSISPFSSQASMIIGSFNFPLTSNRQVTSGLR